MDELTGRWGSGRPIARNCHDVVKEWRMRGSRWVGLLMMALPVAARAQAPVQHPISAATQAAIARQVPQLLAQKGVRHVGFYGFTVDRAGHVLSEWVVRPSGRASLDRLALAAIGKAILKQLPANAPPRMQFVVPIEFHKNGAMAQPGGPPPPR
jgi:TonB family protein